MVACSGSGRRESSTLIEAIDRYRVASDASKPGQAQLVAAVPCSAIAVCEAKRVCFDAIDPTTRALAIKDEVAARIVDIEERRLSVTANDALSLSDKLDEADRLITKARSKMSECERRLADLRAQYGG
jgi:hypothetical protein